MGDREVDCRTLESKDNAMNDLVASMRHEASEYEFDQYAATLLLKAADRIERLEAELAAANVQISAIRHYAAEQLGWNENYGPEMSRILAMCGALVSPKPTDNSEDDQC